jgi:hypothetical protein
MATIKHKSIYTTYYWNKATDYKVYDFNDGVNLSKKQFDDSYVVNVPCYKISDISECINGFKSNYVHVPDNIVDYFVHITTDNHRGGQHSYLLSTPTIDKFIQQKVTFGALQGNRNKMPKLHHKTVRVHNRGKGYGPQNKMKVDCYIANKDLSAYLNKEVSKQN